MNLFQTFTKTVLDAISSLEKECKLPGIEDTSKVSVEPPRDATHGDIATNAAMILAKQAKMAPRQIAELLVGELMNHPDIAAADVAGPGFINLTLEQAFWPRMIKSVLEEGVHYGSSDYGNGEKVNVEYVSANPTGPLHIGHCRGAIYGDALARLLTETGYDVDKEYYFNDAGVQIDVLAQSAFLRYREALGEDIGEIPSGLYPGEYLIDIGKEIAGKHGNSLLKTDPEEATKIIRDEAVAHNMAAIREDMHALNIHHDIYFNESSLHESNDGISEVDQTINQLREEGDVFEGRIPPPKGKLPEDWEDREQTLFRATAYGDDIDRPLMKSDGSYTYFAADVAYMHDKLERGYKQLIFVLGADHGGYVKRLEAVCSALAGNEAKVIVLLCQLVKLFRSGEPVRMSKRAGDFITLREVIKEVGPDVLRFVVLYRKNEAPLDFDFVKVTEQSRDNPVFYVQYAHARICSVFEKAKVEMPSLDLSQESLEGADFKLLSDEAEFAVIRKIGEYPRLVLSAAVNHEPHRIAFFLYELAGEFHTLWNRGKESPQLRFINENDTETTRARIALLAAVRYVLSNGLKILGVKPVEEM
ncbi:MAG: arginine--tRNA ligase [Hyphomicrobiales bacterium]